MSSQPSICDRTRIELFLSDQLGDEEQADLAQHLDSCNSCRTTLDELAADQSLWRETREHLGDSDLFDESFKDEFQTSTMQETQYREAGTATDVRLGFLKPTDDPRMLGRFGGYEVVGVIGYGGMGIVLKGLDAALNRYVAIKVLSPHLAASGAARRRFAREAQAAAAVVHENVVAIHGVSESDGLPFFIMPYVRGTSLQKRLDEQGPFSTVEVLRVGMQTAMGLAAAHAQGLVHRDIKPANILLADGVERVKLTDFGLARAVDDASLTRTGVIAGTPQYMSPEQARGETIDARSDLFSLGSVLYAMSTGRPPFRAETSLGVLRRISDADPRPIQEINSDAPAWLAAIITRLHATDPNDRLDSAELLAKLLEQCLAHVQQPALVELPRECRPLHKKTSFGKRLPIPRLKNLSSNRPLVTRVVLAICALLIVIAVNLSMVSRRESVRVSDPSAATHDTRGNSWPGTAGLSSAFAWDDGVSERIQRSQQRIEILKYNSQQLWGVENPSNALSRAPSTETNSLSNEVIE